MKEVVRVVAGAVIAGALVVVRDGMLGGLED